MSQAESDLQAECRRLREETLRILELSRADRLLNLHLGGGMHAPCTGSGMDDIGISGPAA